MNSKDAKRKKKLAARKEKSNTIDYSKFVFPLPEAKEQICQVCGNVYTGIRTRLCEDIRCREWFAMEKAANAYKYGPVNSYPVGGLFYQEFIKSESESESEDKE